MPLNYLKASPGKEPVNRVRVNYGGGNTSQVVSFGQGEPSCEVLDVESLVPDLSSYLGDSVVRKFPYDPNDPYYETESIE